MLEFLLTLSLFSFLFFLVKWRRDNQKYLEIVNLQQKLLTQLEELKLIKDNTLMIKHLNASLNRLRKLSENFKNSPREYLEEYAKQTFEKVDSGQFSLEFFFDTYLLAYFTYLQQVDVNKFNELTKSDTFFILT